MMSCVLSGQKGVRSARDNDAFGTKSNAVPFATGRRRQRQPWRSPALQNRVSLSSHW